MRYPRLVPVLLITALLTGLAAYVVPRGVEAGTMLAIADDPVQIETRALDKQFNAAVAEREIKAALANGDADLARSFVDLASARHIPLDSDLKAKVRRAVAKASSAGRQLVSFTRGFITGVPDDGAALAGTALGDLSVYGDVRDAVREGAHLALGQPADTMILGLAAVGLAITAATYSSFGAAEPARLGLTLAKAVRKTGRLSGALAATIARTLRSVVDWRLLRRVSIAEPAAAIRTARQAVKLRRTGELMKLGESVARIGRKAGPRAAMASLQIAKSPREVARIAKVAEREGSKTRAIVKLLGRGAIMLTVSALNLSSWILGALFTLFGLVASLKRATERITIRFLRRRKERRLECRRLVTATYVRF